jgi:hypothetical protein
MKWFFYCYSCKDDGKFEERVVYDFSSVSHYFYNYKNIKIACVPLSNKYTVNQYIFAANNIHVFSCMYSNYLQWYDFPFYVACSNKHSRICYIHESLERNSHARLYWFTVYRPVDTDLLYKSTVHNSCQYILSFEHDLEFCVYSPKSKKYHKKIYNNFQTISEYYESS